MQWVVISLDKDSVVKCIEEVSQLLRDFLINEGGYANRYNTYVSGTVLKDKDGILYWLTPVAQEELTQKGKEVRGTKLYKDVQEIMKKYGIDKLVIRHRDEGYGAMVTEVVYVEETKAEVRFY
jgi:hypothetical protein